MTEQKEQESMVIPSQGEIHVFRNASGGITIREERDGDEMWISFKDEHVEDVILAIRKIASYD